MTSVVKYQDETSSVWYDVIDVDDSRNYLEATCSSMFAYCLLKGARMGYLDASYQRAGLTAYRGIVKEFVKKNSNGTISLTKCCEVSGLGPESNPRRDGSFEYYISENVRDNDPKGIGPFIWASLEMESLGYNVNNLNEDLLTGIPVIENSELRMENDAPRYNLAGQRVDKNGKGIFIQQGRKYLKK